MSQKFRAHPSISKEAGSWACNVRISWCYFHPLEVRDRKKGHYERGLFTGGISRISKVSKFSRKWSASPLFSRVRRFSEISGVSTFWKDRSFLSREVVFDCKAVFKQPRAAQQVCIGECQHAALANTTFVFTVGPEMITQIIQKQFFCVTDVCVCNWNNNSNCN